MNKTAIQAESFHRVNTIELVPTPKIDSENEDSDRWRLQTRLERLRRRQLTSMKLKYSNEAKHHYL